MARTTITAHPPLGSYPTLPIGAAGADLIFTATDDPLDRQTPLLSGKTVVFAYNSGGSARTITFTSAEDTYHRKGDISAYSVDPGKVAMFGPFSTGGWANGGQLYIDVSNAELRLAVLTLP